MKIKHIMILILLLTFISVKQAWAPISGIFPGLDELIEESDIIAIVKIVARPDMRLANRGGYIDFRVEVEKTLKGTMSLNETILSLRWLPWRSDNLFFKIEFAPYSRHIIFIEQKNYPNRKKGASIYRNLNCEGSHLEVFPYFKLKELQGSSPKEIIIELLQDYLKRKTEELKALEEKINIITGKELK